MDDRMMVLAGPASAGLGAAVCETLGVTPTAYECIRFPDGETRIDIQQSVRACDVYVVQSTSPPVAQHLMELLLIADACRRAGAARLTAVIPYLGYARQERRTQRQALGGRVMADIIGTGHFERLMLIDAHTPAIEGFFGIPVEHLTAVPLLAGAAGPSLNRRSVVVAPDLGAVKRAREYGRLLDLPVAVVHKTRLDGEAVEAHEVIGDVTGKQPLIVDDMLSTGATLAAAVGALRAAGAVEPITVAVTHVLLAGRAREILATLPLARLIAADTVAREPHAVPRLEFTSVAPLIATAIRRDHRHESLADLRMP